MLTAGYITFKDFLTVADFPKKDVLLKLVNEREDIEGQMQQVQIENLKLKAQINPELLSPEEQAQLEEIIRQEQNEQLTAQMAPNDGQAVVQEI